MAKDDRETVRDALSPRLDGAFSKLLAAARAEGYARAREQAAGIAEMSRAEVESLIAAGTTADGMRVLEAEMATAEEIRDDIRAMQDERAGKQECLGAPDCGWHNGGPCEPCKAKVKP